MVILRKFVQSDKGAVSVETSLLITITTILTACAIEASLALWQWNSAQQAARQGARLAATSNVIATDISTMTGLSESVVAGDPLPYYLRTCSGATASCNVGGFDETALNLMVFGKDGDGVCGATTPRARGICDVFADIRPENIEIKYEASGFGVAGLPAKPAPMITVTVRDLEFDYVFLDAFFPNVFSKIPPVSVSVMSEDLSSQA